MRYFPLVALLLVMAATPALACAPCKQQMTLEQTVKVSEHIIIGKRIDSSKEQQPEYIEMEVEADLKGDLQPGAQVKVKSWTNDCAFGIVAAKDIPAVFFLKKRDGKLDAVDFGCSVKTLPYENGFITVDNALMGVSVPGSEVLSLKAFVNRFLPEKAKASP